ncbi:hypothetical protein MNEG_12224 [Monoraphidium neglectum]|uniref:Uncharacterized protein n=1 Tax=Monoraphidium neglectum TaxID=145388 RepID=A0A0D2LW90_9CHLO|nr:hypothetical protein MNEG_12224 [Monoraphidium neglectum]KIY95739.1 hypothetical protein MNEG_12224 [Monoraphidium neglectum]|eukprot:XP_013894759.1 hypothetical protein MNEG_12224 [Monoraphidium neglectum]
MRDALQDQSVTRIVLVEDVTLTAEEFAHNSVAKSYAVYLSRNVNVTALAPDVSLNFDFLGDAAVIEANRTVVMFNMTISNSRRGAGLGVDFFVGAGEAATSAL